MSMRTSSTAALLLLTTACGPGAPSGSAASKAPERIVCAHGGDPLAPDCVAEHDGDVLTIRFADGGFRRMLLASDGLLSAADGADAPTLTRNADGTALISIGGDRFAIADR